MKFVVSGRVHEISEKILLKYPETLLGTLGNLTTSDQTKYFRKFSLKDRSTVHMGDDNIIHFNRHYSSFEAVLDFFYLDELHMPKGVCPKIFQRELNFWMLDASDLEPCCRFDYLHYFDEYQTKSEFNEILDNTYPNEPNHSRYQKMKRFSYYRERLWAILDHTEASVPAKVLHRLVSF